MPTRKAHAGWEDITGSKGQVAFGNGLFKAPYSFTSRFENAAGTNLEELLGAAHASCFAMALSLMPDGFWWDRHNMGPKPKNGAPNGLSSPESRRSAPDRLLAASDSAAAIVTTTESSDPGLGSVASKVIQLVDIPVTLVK